MSNLSKNHTLIFIAAFLAALQFIYKPWLGYMQSQQEQLLYATRQLERVNRLISSGDNLMQLHAQAQQVKQELFEQFPIIENTQSDGQFRLNYQQKVGQQLQDKQVQLELFDWIVTTEDTPMFFYSARIVLRGQAVNLMQAYMTVFYSQPGLQVQQFTLQHPPFQQAGADATLTLQIQLAALSSVALTTQAANYDATNP